jgi:signal transduction histidine kinase
MNSGFSMHGIFSDGTILGVFRDLLRIINASDTRESLISGVTSLLNQATGCDAVGIRLHDKGDFPYFETRGFPSQFVVQEKSVCKFDESGNIILDRNGNPVFGCMCGNVLMGRVDTSLPYFTPYGCFITNSFSNQLANPAEVDAWGLKQINCCGMGYESVGLIPLKNEGRILGLLQINHTKPGFFTPELIRFLENAAENIALALSKLQVIQALRESEETYRSLFDSMLNGLAYCRMIWENGKPTDFVYLAVNSAFETQTGLHDPVGKRVSELIPGIRENDPAILEIYGRVVSTGVPESFEIHLSSLDMWFAVSVFCPKPDHFVAVFDVITERKKAEAEIRRLNENLEHLVQERTKQLEEANNELESFSYSVSHDLRAPLRSINGFAQILKDNAGHYLTDEDKSLCDKIHANTITMDMLITDLLAFSRLGRTEMRSDVVNMHDLVNDVFLDLTTEEGRAGILFSCEELPQAVCDPSLFRHVWINLIGNAIKYSATRDKSVIAVSGRMRDDTIEYSIRDNGVGFDMQYADKLFAVFQRLHDDHMFEGNGIGLALVHRIIQRHGGRVWAESELNAGTTIHFSLPVR